MAMTEVQQAASDLFAHPNYTTLTAWNNLIDRFIDTCPIEEIGMAMKDAGFAE